MCINFVKHSQNTILWLSFTCVNGLGYIMLAHILLSGLPIQLLGQSEAIQGIVFDKATGQRIGKVLVRNDRTKDNAYNNARGEFDLSVDVGDAVIAGRDGYRADTIVYEGQKVLLFYLERSAILIPKVDVFGRKSPEAVLKERREEFDKAYKSADPGDLLSSGSASGAGLGINYIYNLLSREGKNARRLTGIIRREYEDNVIDSKFARDLVHNLTGLKDGHLDNFMSNYRPSYDFALTATPYELTSYIKRKYEIFKLNPNLRFLPKLPEIVPKID